MSVVLAVLSQASVFAPLSMGIYISTSILGITDLAIDGSFLMGAATFTVLSLKHCNPLLSLLCAMIAGSLMGLISGFFQLGGKIQPIIAGMLTVFLAHGAFFLLMNGPNVSLYGGLTFSNFIEQTPIWARGISPLIISACLGLGLLKTITSRLGICLQTFGANPLLLTQLGKNPEYFRLIGLAISNAAAGISGALTAQQNGYADVSMGFGVTLIGIATVLIGTHLVKSLMNSEKLSIKNNLWGCVLGTFVYFFFITLLLMSGISPLYLKSVFAIVLGIGLYATSPKAKIS